MPEVKKIVAIGPESTGKSTLCQLLANHYSTLWCPEYARQYLTERGAEYTYDDLLTIAKGQLALESEFAQKIALIPREDNAAEASSLLFCDTDLYVVKVWSEYVFQKCDPFILNHLAALNADLYLLCSTDLPWVKDELREYPDVDSREELYNIYKDILLNQHVPWVEIKGPAGKRLQTALNAVDQLLVI